MSAKITSAFQDAIRKTAWVYDAILFEGYGNTVFTIEQLHAAFVKNWERYIQISKEEMIEICNILSEKGMIMQKTENGFLSPHSVLLQELNKRIEKNISELGE